MIDDIRNRYEAFMAFYEKNGGEKSQEVDDIGVLLSQLDKLRGENTCDSCLGQPLESGATCMCGGTGKMSDAVYCLRRQLVEQSSRLGEILKICRAYIPEDAIPHIIRTASAVDSQCHVEGCALPAGHDPLYGHFSKELLESVPDTQSRINEDIAPDYIFTKLGTRGHQQLNAYKTPLPHEPMERWVRCYLVGDDLVIPGDPNHRDPHGPMYERLESSRRDAVAPDRHEFVESTELVNCGEMNRHGCIHGWDDEHRCGDMCGFPRDHPVHSRAPDTQSRINEDYADSRITDETIPDRQEPPYGCMGDGPTCKEHDYYGFPPCPSCAPEEQ